jgi:hypothetical protein
MTESFQRSGDEQIEQAAPAPASTPISAAPLGCVECVSPRVTPGGVSVQPVYAIGNLEARFPSLGVEREFAQAAGQSSFLAAPEVRLLVELLRRPENAYLGRQICWTLVAQGIDVMSLASESAVNDLLDAVDDITGQVVTVIGEGHSGGCLGIDSLTVTPAQLLWFKLEELADHIGQSVTAANDEQSRRPTTETVTYLARRIIGREGNLGLTPESRALNYLLLRYSGFHGVVADLSTEGLLLQGIEAQHSHRNSRVVVEVRLVFREPRSDVHTYQRCQVDVTDIFPFLMTQLEETFDN